jgi:hypothetical protein
MSVPRGFGLNGKSFYTNVCMPKDVHFNFVVDSANGNGLGLRSLKSNGYVEHVYMSVQNGLPGTPSLGSARGFAAFGASAVTNTGSSVLTGNLGIYPGTAVTGFPPGTFSGVLDVANAAALAAKNSAQAAYTDLAGRTSTVIATALDGQTLTPGVYSSASGTFTLAQSAGGTLTLNGAGVYVFKMATTLTTGAGGVPVINLTGGALASNVYWQVGSSATINSGSAGTFQGNIIANTSITDTLGGTVNGSLIALNGAVTFSAASVVNVEPLAGGFVAAGNPNPLPGYAWIQFKNNFNYYLGGFSGFVSPLSPSNVVINSTSLVLGQPYVIVSVGSSTLADWQAVGLPQGFLPTVGQSFIAIKSGNGAGSGLVRAPLVSGINSVEVIGDPNQMLNNSNIATNAGAWLLVQFLSNGVPTAPVDGSIVGMVAQFDGSSVSIDGI